MNVHASLSGLGIRLLVALLTLGVLSCSSFSSKESRRICQRAHSPDCLSAALNEKISDSIHRGVIFRTYSCGWCFLPEDMLDYLQSEIGHDGGVGSMPIIVDGNAKATFESLSHSKCGRLPLTFVGVGEIFDSGIKESGVVTPFRLRVTDVLHVCTALPRVGVPTNPESRVTH